MACWQPWKGATLTLRSTPLLVWEAARESYARFNPSKRNDRATWAARLRLRERVQWLRQQGAYHEQAK
jgi:hypothetical protein